MDDQPTNDLPVKLESKTEFDGFTLFRSRSAFDRWLKDNPSILERRRAWSRDAFELAAPAGPVEGGCSACGELRRFDPPPDAEALDFRETLNCRICALNARARMVAELSERFLHGLDEPVPYATEQTSHYFRWLKSQYPTAIGSEYFEDASRERLQNYLYDLIGPDEVLRFEDATRLSLSDRSIDLVTTSEVLEHVHDHVRALKEFRRVLRPGGRMVLTVPFAWDRDRSLLRARLTDNGRVEHLMEPEYHGDPMSDDGVLAFHSFGWDLLDDVRAAGFADVCWALCWKPGRLLLADLWVLIARVDPPMTDPTGTLSR